MPMTIDQAIAALQRARAKLGGGTTLWAKAEKALDKWDEELVCAIEPVDDGESRYVRLVCAPERTPRSALEAAGFTVHAVTRPGRWFEVERDGQYAAVLYQHDGAWHWFSLEHAATASGSRPEECHRGGLGDAVSDDHDLHQYRRLIRSAPDHLRRDYKGVAAAYSQVTGR